MSTLTALDDYSQCESQQSVSIDQDNVTSVNLNFIQQNELVRLNIDLYSEKPRFYILRIHVFPLFVFENVKTGFSSKNSFSIK